MNPFNQTESAMTKTAKELAPSYPQLYCAPIQQTTVRERINAVLATLFNVRGSL